MFAIFCKVCYNNKKGGIKNGIWKNNSKTKRNLGIY